MSIARQTTRAVRRILLVGTLVGAAALVLAAPAIASTSSKVGYVTDFGLGSNDPTGPPSIPGSSIFVNALTGSPPSGTYTTADSSKTATLTDVTVKTIDAGGVGTLASFDTLILYQVCDIASHPKTMEAVNTFLANGGKVMIFDGDRCATVFPGVGEPDYSSFLFPFKTANPGPKGEPGSYTKLVSSTLTSGLVVGPQEGDSVGDANIFTAFEGPWCASITAENVLKFNEKEEPEGVKGFVEASAQTPKGGLVIYEGEDFWFSFGPTPHLRLVFDNMLKQDWAPAGLACPIPASGISLSPPSQTHPTGSTAKVTAKVVDIEGKPVEKVEVTFEVTGGPNKGTKGTATTNASGEAEFTYTGGSSTGTDEVVASFIDSLKNKHTSNTVKVQWEVEAATTTGGNFVIGDEAAAVGTSVTFWGAKWWKLNSLSGGGAPAAFKGFADTPSTPPACGTSWSTDPGNSSHPPAGPLPEFIEVIVSSHVTKSGPTISGDTREVVVVKTNSGYAPNPGHAGTGEVVAVVCHS